MEFSQVVANRHSVRDFTDQPVSQEDLVDIVRTAQQAPSWVNSQPWRVYAATGATLAGIKKRHAADVAAGRKGNADLPVKPRTEWSATTQENMVALGEQISAQLGEGVQEFQASQGRLFNAQAALYVTIPVESTLWSFDDLGAFSAMLVLAAADKGLGAINAYALVMYPDEVREAMGIGADEIVAIGIALGHPADSAPPAQEEDEGSDHGRAGEQDRRVEPRDLEVGQVLALKLADEQAQRVTADVQPQGEEHRPKPHHRPAGERAGRGQFG